MKVAVIGSRGLSIPNLEAYLPEDTTEIISGGARGVDTSARNYALSHGIKLTEFLPEYETYGRSAPLKRNITIIENADFLFRRNPSDALRAGREGTGALPKGWRQRGCSWL